jgi:hypothetical protein
MQRSSIHIPFLSASFAKGTALLMMMIAYFDFFFIRIEKTEKCRQKWKCKKESKTF